MSSPDRRWCPRTPGFGTQAGKEEVSMPVVFGPFSKVWDDLGSFDMKINSLRNRSSQGSVCSTTTTDSDDNEVDSLCSEADNPGPEVMLDIAECQSPSKPPRSLVASTPLTRGRFSEVWCQLGDPGRSGTNSTGQDNCKAEQHTVPSSPAVGSIKVMNLAGNLVGEFDISPGMTVSTLKDRIATTRGDLPVTMTLLRDADALDDAEDLWAFARQNVANSMSLTLVHAAPSIGRGSFSIVWDELSNLDARLGNFGSLGIS